MPNKAVETEWNPSTKNANALVFSLLESFNEVGYA